MITCLSYVYLFIKIFLYMFAQVVNEKAIKWIYIQFFLPFSKNGEDIFDFHFN